MKKREELDVLAVEDPERVGFGRSLTGEGALREFGVAGERRGSGSHGGSRHPRCGDGDGRRG